MHDTSQKLDADNRHIIANYGVSYRRASIIRFREKTRIAITPSMHDTSKKLDA